MTDLCRCLEAFCDGELNSSAAQAFADHLPGCSICQGRLHEAIQLQALEEEARELHLRRDRRALRAVRAAAPAPASSRPTPRSRRWVPLLALAAAGVLWCWPTYTPSSPTSPEAAPLVLASQRGIEARLVGSVAALHRPYQTERASDGGEPEPVALAALLEFERREDWLGLAGLHILKRNLHDAAAAAARAPETADTYAIQSAIALVAHRPEDALRWAERAVAGDPMHTAGHFNMALALRDLGLTALAAEHFDRVAEQGEPGWQAEALKQAQDLRGPMLARARGYYEALAVSERLYERGDAVPDTVVGNYGGIVRPDFHNALRTVTDRAQLDRLRPLAEALERAGQSGALGAWERARGLDLDARRDDVRLYRDVLARRVTLEVAPLRALISKLANRREHDLVIGFIVATGSARQLEAEARRALAEISDPWFTALIEQELAIAETDKLRALGHARQAFAVATEASLKYRALLAQETVAWLEAVLLQADAQETARTGLRAAEAAGLWGDELAFFQRLGEWSRSMTHYVMSRAYQHEVMARDRLIRAETFAPSSYAADACKMVAYAQTLLAVTYLEDLLPEAALQELELIDACPETHAPLLEASVRVELARMLTDPDQLEEALERSASFEPKPDSVDVSVQDYVMARIALARDPALGRAQLHELVESFEGRVRSPAEAEMRALSYTELILDAAREGRHLEALRLMADEIAVPPPTTCVIGSTVSFEQSAVVVRGVQGRISGEYREWPLGVGSEPELDLTTATTEALHGCEKVDVYARPPLTGRVLRLPREIAWSYRVTGGRTPPERRESRLVIGDVRPPAGLHLAQLHPPDFGSPPVLTLRGAEATPSRILRALTGEAAIVEFHTHGKVAVGDKADKTRTGGAFLVVSPEPGDETDYRITAEQVQNLQLQSHPIVVLAACDAARVGRYVHEPWGLPLAFLRAGASVVIASPDSVPDREADAFFADLRVRLQRGGAPAEAVRDARVAATAGPSPTWLDSVLVFE